MLILIILMQVVQNPAPVEAEYGDPHRLFASVKQFEPGVRELGEKEKPASEAQQLTKNSSTKGQSLDAQVPKTTDTNQNELEDLKDLKSNKGEELLRADSSRNDWEKQKEDRRRKVLVINFKPL